MDAENDCLPTSWLLHMLRYECDNISTRCEQMWTNMLAYFSTSIKDLQMQISSFMGYTKLKFLKTKSNETQNLQFSCVSKVVISNSIII